MTKSKLSIIRKSKKIEFKFENEFYIFERRSEKNLSYDFIWSSSGEKIYGPFQGDQSEEGQRIYKFLIRKIDKKK